MWRTIFPLLTVLFVLFTNPSCRNGHSAPLQPVEVPDSVFLAPVAYSGLHTDSLSLVEFLKAHRRYNKFAGELHAFYSDRDYSYAWFTEEGISEQAGHFLNMIYAYAIELRDSTIINPQLDSLAGLFTDELVSHADREAAMEATELLLTLHFFEYSERSYVGTKVNPRDLSWYIPRKKIDLQSLLSAMTDKSKDSMAFREPVMRQYRLLKEKLVEYYTLEPFDTIGNITMSVRRLDPGDSSAAIAKIRAKLHLLGDLPQNDGSTIYDETLLEAVERFQHRHGLATDGVIGQQTLNALNVPLTVRIRQILVNLERNRWVPYEMSGDFLVVNIPEYMLHVHQDGKYAWSTPVIVGKAVTNTVIFNDMMKYVVFSPFWNIPASIQRNKIEPAIGRNPNYLAQMNMERMPNGTIRQRPGPNNALGRVKFLFPNQYSIYLHDTPTKDLFNEPVRMFSHGCIRVKNPEKLAAFLLRKQPEWTEQEMEAAMSANRERWVELKEKVPVFIGYFTAWVDGEGMLQFRDDVYGHDKRMERVLFADKPIL